jgi:predicted Zn-dependent protease
MAHKQTKDQRKAESDDAAMIALLREGKYSRARRIARNLMIRNPADPIFPVVVAHTFVAQKKYKEGVKFVESLKQKFPRVTQLLEVQALGLHALQKDALAEQTELRLLELLPVSSRAERGDCCYRLGTACWRQAKREDALAWWRQALLENPLMTEAREALSRHTNEYGEAKPPAREFDDIYHFQRIQLQKYMPGRKEAVFSSESEMTKVLGAIFQAWNEQIAPRAHELDGMTAAEKTALFQTVDVDFSAEFLPVRPVPQRRKSRKR